MKKGTHLFLLYDKLMLNNEELKKEVEKIKWFHKIDLGNDLVTPGRKKTFQEIKRIGIPENLEGKTVLDIGAWDGYYSFESEKRGAKRVLATDYYIWAGRGWGSKAGFELARRVLNSKVEDKLINVFDISPETVGTFDIVLFLGVLYHLQNPLLALEKISNVTKELAIIETVCDMLDYNRPAIAFYPNNELAGDPTNWCGPNFLAMESMLKTVGFKTIKIFSKNPGGYRIDGKPGVNDPDAPNNLRILHNRAVFHAFK